MAEALQTSGGDVGTRPRNARPARRDGYPEWRGSGALHAGDRTPRSAVAVHWLISTLPEHSRVSILHGTDLAGAQRAFARRHSDSGERTRCADPLAPVHRIAVVTNG